MVARVEPGSLDFRPTKIREVLDTIVEDATALDIRPMANLSDHVIGPMPHGVNFSTLSDPSEIRIKTAWDDLYFNYHEIWQYDGSRYFNLNRAYLHLYLARGASTNEVQSLSLHCDPAMSKEEPSYKYKRGPHLHIGEARPDISRSHISLCVGDPHVGGNNVNSLMGKFKKAVEMIAVEVIPRYFSH